MPYMIAVEGQSEAPTLHHGSFATVEAAKIVAEGLLHAAKQDAGVYILQIVASGRIESHPVIWAQMERKEREDED